MTGAAVLLCSGGLDSTVVAAIAAERHGNLIFVTFDYGQRHDRELLAARAVAEHFHGEQVLVAINARAWGGSALTDDSMTVPQGRSIDDSIPVTYVPARNLIFLSVALGIGEARDAEVVYIGVNALDYSGYPDCRPEFLAAFEKAGALALKRGVEGRPLSIEAPLISMSKAEIVQEGVRLGAPLELTWSCYVGEARPCGTCDACVLRTKGFADAGIADPALADG